MSQQKHQKKAAGRLDKYYHLAKEQGFRARSAFKLVQLNKKYEFLGNANVVIDLCAAPGGWLQVCQKSMPPGSTIIGVDLVQIKPIPNVVCLKEDITSANCRKLLKENMNGEKADIVLHDGSPNVGSNWFYDAYSQNELTLVSLKLAAEFLKPDGIFITKVFRSQDYTALLWVFNQLFKSVECTKPPASRSESAEIYAYCSGFLAPVKIDQRIFDPTHIFSSHNVAEGSGKTPLSSVLAGGLDINNPTKRIRSRQGYADGAHQILSDSCSVLKFVMADGETAIKILSSVNTLVFDEQSKLYEHHPLTKKEIKILMSDLKVLGKADFHSLMKWKLKMLNYTKSLEQKPVDEVVEVRRPLTEEEIAEKDSQRVNMEIESLEQGITRKSRIERRREAKRINRAKERMVAMIQDQEDGPIADSTVFALDSINSASALDDVRNASIDVDEEEEDSTELNVDDEDQDLDASELKLRKWEKEMDLEYIRYMEGRVNTAALAKKRVGLQDVEEDNLQKFLVF